MYLRQIPPYGGGSAGGARRVLVARHYEADAVALVLEDSEGSPAAVLALLLGGWEGGSVVDDDVAAVDRALCEEGWRERAIAGNPSPLGSCVEGVFTCWATTVGDVDKRSGNGPAELNVTSTPMTAWLPVTPRQLTVPSTWSVPWNTNLTSPDGFSPDGPLVAWKSKLHSPAVPANRRVLGDKLSGGSAGGGERAEGARDQQPGSISSRGDPKRQMAPLQEAGLHARGTARALAERALVSAESSALCTAWPTPRHRPSRSMEGEGLPPRAPIRQTAR